MFYKAFITRGSVIYSVIPSYLIPFMDSSIDAIASYTVLPYLGIS